MGCAQSTRGKRRSSGQAPSAQEQDKRHSRAVGRKTQPSSVDNRDERKKMEKKDRQRRRRKSRRGSRQVPVHAAPAENACAQRYRVRTRAGIPTDIRGQETGQLREPVVYSRDYRIGAAAKARRFQACVSAAGEALCRPLPADGAVAAAAAGSRPAGVCDEAAGKSSLSRA